MNLRRIRSFIPLATAVLFLVGGSEALAEQTTSPTASPGVTQRILRALGLESPPGPQGDKAYGKGDYEEALRQYGKAVEETPPESPVRPLLDRKIGNALYKQGRYPEATEYYEQSLKGSALDSQFSARTHYNLGNTYYRKGEAAYAADSTKLDPAIADLRESLAHYKKSLRLDNGDVLSKQNLEMAGTKLQQLLKKQEQQKQQQQQGKPPEPPEPSPRAREALARALQLTQERRYAEATSVLKEIMKTDRTAASFSAHVKRLDDVMKILRGERPDDPASQDPRATPWKPGPPGMRQPGGTP